MIDIPLSPSMLIVPRSVSFSAWLGHIPFASWLVEQLQPQSIVELGTHRGSSFLALCQAVQEQGLTARVFAIDTWEGDEHAGYYGDEIYNALREYQQRNYAGISEMLRMRFNEALPYFADGSIDLLHIDGLHTYEAVREDFETWLPKLSDRAVVIFHDTCVRERGFGVWQYWSEISQQYPAFEFTHTHGLGVLLVGRQRVPALADLAARAAAGDFAPINRFFDALGSNIKRAEEVERVNAGLADARNEVNRLGTLGHELQQRCLQLEQEVRDGREQVRQAEQQVQQARERAEHSAVTAEDLRRIVAEERARTVEDIQAALGPHLDSQARSMDRLLQPWWRR
jgi:outer membrane murein-binding lipoprotein Lpp